MKKLFCILLLLSYSLSSQSMDDVLELYKDKKYDQALEILDSIKLDRANTDDALYLSGKIYQKKNNHIKAEEAYLEIINNYPRSGKYSIAKVNVTSIYTKQKEWIKIIDLLQSINTDKNSKNNNRLLSSYAYAYFKEASKTKYLKREKLVDRAIELYEIVIPRTEKKKDRINLCRLYALKLSIAPWNTVVKSKFNMLYDELIKADYLSKKTVNYIDRLLKKTNRKNKTILEADVFAVYSKKPALFSDLNIGRSIAGKKGTFDVGIKFKYNPFTYKSFNFEDRTAKDRHLQWTFDSKAYLNIIAGNKNSIYNDLSFEGSYRAAEYKDDNSIGMLLSDDLSIRFNQTLKAAVSGDIGFKQFPNYLVNDNKIDYIITKLNPKLTIYPIENLMVSINSKMTYKGYTQATYYDSNDNRYYLIFNPGIELNYKKSIINGTLFMNYEILNSYNYDKLVKNKVIKDYGDYRSPILGFKVVVKPIKNLKFRGKLSYSITEHLNNEARSKDNKFIDELRKDSEFSIDTSTEYRLNKHLSIIGQYKSINKESNMKYEKYFITNIEYQTIFLGVSLSL